MEACPCLSATCLAEQPELDRRRTHAPADTNSSATSMWFPAAAACSGVRPGRGNRGGGGSGGGEGEGVGNGFGWRDELTQVRRGGTFPRRSAFRVLGA